MRKIGKDAEEIREGRTVISQKEKEKENYKYETVIKIGTE